MKNTHNTNLKRLTCLRSAALALGASALIGLAPSANAILLDGAMKTVLAPDGGLPTFSTSVTNQSLSTPTSRLSSSFDIVVNVIGSMTPAQMQAFNAAEAFWESHLWGYQPGVSITGVTIDAQIGNIDGPGGVLGQAGPTAGGFQAGFLLATDGLMRFDEADTNALIAANQFGDVIRHEMAHVLGFGSLWDFEPIPGLNNGVSENGTGRYTGAKGLATYQSEFNQPGATFVPLELGGGPGTADGHWDEIDGGGAPTGVTDALGRDLRNELMTGWLDTPTFVSDTTLASFEDIGFVSSLSHRVPDFVSTGALFAIAFGAIGAARIRRRTA